MKNILSVEVFQQILSMWTYKRELALLSVEQEKVFARKETHVGLWVVQAFPFVSNNPSVHVSC